MDSSLLDTVAHCCIELTEALNAATTETEKDTLLHNHIKKLWHSEPPIEDFKRHLEWVNVTEPLRLTHHCASKIVILDFWTYCCINCGHVLPDLAEIEQMHSIESGVVVIGVHCAKFTNERDSTNILSAVQRFGIKHAVVNDFDSTMWEALGIKCWPTLLILGPANKPLFVLVGEGHKDELFLYIKAAKQYFGEELSRAHLPIKISSHISGDKMYSLKFPGKVSLNPFFRGQPNEPYIVISDTGNHRIVLADCSGNVLKIIGGIESGFKDGKMSEAKFNGPQGLCWLSATVIAVCDTGNHCIRALHLDDDVVNILAGTGSQGKFSDQGGECLGLQALSSPWDIVLFHTPDMDMSIRAPVVPVTSDTDSSIPPPPPLPATTDSSGKEKDDYRRVLLIACAGSHQIWAVFLDTTIWWKYKKYAEGTCICIAGSGAEAARNSSYPATAAFAQPSGLALKTNNNAELLIADSESSSIRRLILSTGQVSTLAGGDKNPLNLFAFGDFDDVGIEAKFQHPLGIAYCESTKSVYVADTYNHKIKQININSQIVTTLYPNMLETSVPAKFNEPSSLSLTADGKYLYIADTNNHCIKQLNISKNGCQEFRLVYPEPKFTEPDDLILYKNDLFVNKRRGCLIIYFDVSLDSADSKSIKFTEGAPQHWKVCVRDAIGADVTREVFDIINSSCTGSKLPGRVEFKIKGQIEKTHYRLYLSFQTALCDNNVCFSHAFTVRSNLLLRDSVKLVESYRLTCRVNPSNQK